jgi:hypothetical protein
VIGVDKTIKLADARWDAGRGHHRSPDREDQIGLIYHLNESYKHISRRKLFLFISLAIVVLMMMLLVTLLLPRIRACTSCMLAG